MIIRSRCVFLLFLVAVGGLCVDVFAQSTRPRWVDTPYSTYTKENYLVAVGESSSRIDAENTAFANLVKIFGTTVKVESGTIITVVDETIQRESEQKIGVAALHTIENASIAEAWQDTRTRQWSALAVLPKQQTAQIFASKINDLNTVIQGYLDEAEWEEDLLYKFSLVDMAAIYAQECANHYTYYNILSPQSMEVVHLPLQIKAQASSIARSITFSIEALNRYSLTEPAIKETLASLGMRSNDVNPVYILSEELTYQGKYNEYGSYILNYIANIELLDTAGTCITVFTFKGKEGGSNEADAVRVVQDRLIRHIANGDSESNTDSLLVQFTAFLDDCLK